MGDNFDILESLTDALDDLENLPENESNSATSNNDTTQQAARQPTQPPPYTQAPSATGVSTAPGQPGKPQGGAPIRAPPPPYPGQQQPTPTSKVSHTLSQCSVESMGLWESPPPSQQDSTFESNVNLLESVCPPGSGRRPLLIQVSWQNSSSWSSVQTRTTAFRFHYYHHLQQE